MHPVLQAVEAAKVDQPEGVVSYAESIEKGKWSVPTLRSIKVFIKQFVQQAELVMLAKEAW